MTAFTFIPPMEEVAGELFQYGGFVYLFDDGAPSCILPIADRYTGASNEHTLSQPQSALATENDDCVLKLDSTEAVPQMQGVDPMYNTTNSGVDSAGNSAEFTLRV